MLLLSSDDKITAFFVLFWQVISEVGDLVGIKYFPAESEKQHQEPGAIKLE